LTIDRAAPGRGRLADDAPAPDPDVSRHTEGALERATEVADAEVEGRSKILDDDFAGKVGNSPL